MLTVKYERYRNDFVPQNEENQFQDMEELVNWMFNQMEHGCVKFFTMAARGQETVKGSSKPQSWRTKPKPTWDGEVVRIRQIEDNNSIIFSDGTFTSGQKHWSKRMELFHSCYEKHRLIRFAW